MKLQKLTIKDKRFFEKYLKLSQHKLCAYAFENIYIWEGLFDIYWALIDESLCVFFKDISGYFLYLPPLAKNLKSSVISEVFKIMRKLNKNRAVSRIENVERKDINFYNNLGYEARYKSCDYISKRTDLSQLKGERFKPKRHSVNYFIKNYKFQYLPFSLKYTNDCIKLYKTWSLERKEKIKDALYQYMLDDNFTSLKTALSNYRDLNFTGSIVKMDGELKAFTFGYRLNKDTFCILFEIADLSVKGLAQFIFYRFCNELHSCKYINIMDDSGLANLKKAKLSYHPQKLVNSYIVAPA